MFGKSSENVPFSKNLFVVYFVFLLNLAHFPDNPFSSWSVSQANGLNRIVIDKSCFNVVQRNRSCACCGCGDTGW